MDGCLAILDTKYIYCITIDNIFIFTIIKNNELLAIGVLP